VLTSGSILEYRGDAFVNAANEGCTGGFGVDEMVNRSGGFALKQARGALGGCVTGEAKVTAAFAHKHTRWIIHAVGPVYRVNPLRQGFDATDPRAGPYMRSLDPLLASAYCAALERARELKARRVGFCLLSAGVFRGERPLSEIVEIGVRTLAWAVLFGKGSSSESDGGRSGLDEVQLIGWTAEEQELLLIIGENVREEIASGTFEPPECQRGANFIGSAVMSGAPEPELELQPEPEPEPEPEPHSVAAAGAELGAWQLLTEELATAEAVEALSQAARAARGGRDPRSGLADGAGLPQR
jgi:O-acetyl-ADP-ribose deacetylase (regulator of RNase III)